MDWSVEQVDELRRLWDTGMPTAEIGRRLGVTKNAVVGKVHRLGLSNRISPIKRVERPAAPVPIPPTVRISYSPFKGPCCSWPIGHPREPGFRFCEAPAVQGKPYCGEHAALAYIPARSRTERAA